MSALGEIAVIASIITLVDFSQKVLARAFELRASRKGVGEAFTDIHNLLAPIDRAVKRTKERIESKEIDERTCKALLPTLRGVDSTLKELKTLLQKCIPGTGASNIEFLWKAGKSVFQEKKVKGILRTLHEYVSVLTFSHAEAGDAGNFSSTEKHDIQQILQHIAHSKTQAAFVPRACRNLLSLDGGGLRGLSILYILGDLMAKVNEGQEPPLKPCEVFDLIGGSGTGG